MLADLRLADPPMGTVGAPGYAAVPARWTSRLLSESPQTSGGCVAASLIPVKDAAGGRGYLRSMSAGDAALSPPAGGGGERVPVLPLLVMSVGTALLLVAVQLKAPWPMLLAERFLPGAGWAQAVLMAAYAAWVGRRLLDPKRQALTRRGIWLLFSAAFYLQLILGVSGIPQFLMTGVLHVPVPALIIAGPIYRGDGLFMPILFLATTLLIGPAWCSHLCYFGAFDALAGGRARPPRRIARGARLFQGASLVAVAAAAAALRVFHAPADLATGLGIGFGAAGIGVMLLVSRRTGRMVHCTAWCPVGLLATVLGKVSPWRVRVAPSCTGCLRCVPACRYNALDPERIRAGSPGASCTLCGDCLTACGDGAMTFSLYGWQARDPAAVRTALTVALTILHAVFLGVARV